MRKIYKYLSVLLSVTMFLTCIPTNALAKKMYPEGKSAKVETKQAKEKKVKKEPKILKEIVEKRESNIKYFLKDDMTYEAAIYPESVHYLKNGQWKDINNDLIDGENDTVEKNEKNYRGLSSEDGFYVNSIYNKVLENKENDFMVKIAKNSKAPKLVSIKKDGYEISWNFSNTVNVKAQKVETNTKEINKLIEKTVDAEIQKDKNYKTAAAEEKAEIRKTKIENEKIKTLTNVSSKVQFVNVQPNVDLQYETKGNNFKENIVIKKRISNPRFKFNLNTNNLIPKLNKENNTIVFYDKKDANKEIYEIIVPFMYDVKHEESSKISVNLEETKTGYEFTIIPDKQWLESKDRAYPVTIDPPVTTPLGRSEIQDTFVCSSPDYFPAPQYLPCNSYKLFTGNRGGSIGVTRSYVKFQMPKEITSADMVVGASLNLLLSADSRNNYQVNVHKVNSNWDCTNLRWNNQPSVDLNKIDDYALVNNSNSKFVSWDVTKMAKEWTTYGNNYGLMLKRENENSGVVEFYSADINNVYSTARPQVIIQYVNNSGLESYWTYHSADVGRAGTGYVNDYNGNLVFTHDDLSMNGNRMPVSIKHIYNSNDKNSSFGYGLGWRLNLSQRVLGPEKFSNGDYYIYIDEDGTKHYFKYNSASGKYEDEAGENLILEINYDNGYDKGFCITDKKNNKIMFTASGYLFKLMDNNGNSLVVHYYGATLDSITDGVGRITKFINTSEGALIGIVDPSGRRTSFAYNGAQLTNITYSDGKQTKYAYDSNNNLVSITNYDGNRITYSYYSSVPYRVNSVSESNIDGTLGGTLSMAYGYNETTFTDVKGRKNVYQFNDSGNTISIKDNDGSAEYYKFLNEDGKKNKLSLESKLQKTVINYLKNHNVEISNDSWNADYWTGSTGSGCFTTEEKYIGKQSLKVVKSNVTTNDSRYFYNQSVTLQKGNTYTLSGYVKTSNISNAAGKGACLFVNYQNADGSYATVDSEYVNGTKDWQRYEVKFTVPANSPTNNVFIRTGILCETGTAYFDCMQLEDGSIANRYNLVENGDLRYGLNYWQRDDTCDGNDVLTTTSDIDRPNCLEGNVFKINGKADKTKNIGQTINVSGNKGDSIIVSGWAKADSVKLTEGRAFELCVGIKKKDGNTQWVPIPFNQDSTAWQYVSQVVISDGDYTSIAYYAIYYHNVNTAYFDGFQLYKEEFGTSYQYDSKGNIISTADLAKKNSNFEYNSSNDLIKKQIPREMLLNMSMIINIMLQKLLLLKM